MFEITNPGPMTDEALNDPAAFAGLVSGMSGDLSQAIDDIGYVSALFSDELNSTGFQRHWLDFARGIMVPTDADNFWDVGHRARWVAEDGIRRMEAADHESVMLARAYLLAGFANRLLGEHFCNAVFDGGSSEPFTAHFERAATQFTTAASLASQYGNTEIENAATAGLASVRAALGDWNGAATLAAEIPLDFQYDAIFSLNSSRETSNTLINYPLEHSEGTVFGTEWEHVLDDTRVPWEVALDPGGAPRMGRDSKTPWYRALKYTSRGDDVALAKGTEMALIRAEAALRDNDIDGMLTQINRARDFRGLDPVDAGTIDEAWDLLIYERGAELWLEGRRFWDRRRWFAEGRDDYIAGHANQCFPIGQGEVDANPNLTN
ncbi:MAG: RagB/SusD family nutrient uptake outer membrane protein [Phycisphaeraceae bacterium]